MPVTLAGVRVGCQCSHHLIDATSYRTDQLPLLHLDNQLADHRRRECIWICFPSLYIAVTLAGVRIQVVGCLCHVDTTACRTDQSHLHTWSTN